MTTEYDMIDRFLRNNLDDDDYEMFNAALAEIAHAASQGEQASKPLSEHDVFQLAEVHHLTPNENLMNFSRALKEQA